MAVEFDTSGLPLDEAARQQIHSAIQKALEEELRKVGHQNIAAIFGEGAVRPVEAE